MKSITAIVLLLICINASAITYSTGTLHINNVYSTNGVFSLKIRSSTPSDNYTLRGVPTNIGYIIARINQFIADMIGDKNAYVQFGYFDGISTQWFGGQCKISLPKNENISVMISSDACTI